MSIKITCLIENQSGEHRFLESEHGLSLLVELDDQHILFDTGGSEKFISNSKKLNKNLTLINHIILSHSHYDHCNGLRPFIKSNGSNFSLWLGQNFFKKKYVLRHGVYSYLGPDFNRDFLLSEGCTLKEDKKDLSQISPHLWIIRNIRPSSSGLNKLKDFVTIEEEEVFQDDFQDEQSLVITSQKGLILVLGCSHPGVVPIIKKVAELFNKPIYGIIGGTHLSRVAEDQLEDTAEFISKMGVSFVGLSHCSGSRIIEYLDKKNIKTLSPHTGSSLFFK